MEHKQGRLAAFLSKGPVQFIGAAGLCIAMGMGLNAVQNTPIGPNTATQESTTAGGHPVRDVSSTQPSTIAPYVPQSIGHYAFDKGTYDWQTFVLRANDLARHVDSPYSDDHIRALPKSADRAAVLGTGPHKLLQDAEGRPLNVAYISEHYHLNAEGLAVAVSDNPAYVGTPIRAVADNAHWLADAVAIGQKPEALRALVQDLHVHQMGAAPTTDVQKLIDTMGTKDLATYAMVMGEAAYTVMEVTGNAQGQKTAAMLVMAGAEAQFQATRTHGKFHDMPMDSSWKQQIASANDVARAARVEEAKRDGTFQGMGRPEPSMAVTVAEKTGKRPSHLDMER